MLERKCFETIDSNEFDVVAGFVTIDTIDGGSY